MTFEKLPIFYLKREKNGDLLISIIYYLVFSILISLSEVWKSSPLLRTFADIFKNSITHQKINIFLSFL